MPTDPTRFRDADRHRALVWGLAYRMTGIAQDADEVTQDTYLRLWERPPADVHAPLRPWLASVALNLSRDRLRARRRRRYLGPWLPTPVPDARLAEEELDARQLATTAFLRAAEALTPTQRAVWLAREVLELSAAETARALGTSAGAVDVCLHHARARLGSAPRRPTRVDDAVLLAFLGALRLGLVDAAAALLHPDVETLNDGGGHVNAARRPVRGVQKVLRFLRRLRRLYPVEPTLSLHRCNGALLVMGEVPPRGDRLPSRFTFSADVARGRIVRIYSVLSPEKLAAL